MPAHDWTRVDAGVFHAFHNAWITHLQDSLNDGRLPEGFYALGEQRSGDFGPDVLTLEFGTHSDGPVAEHWQNADQESGTVLLTDAPPKTRYEMECEKDDLFYLARQRTITVRQSKDDRVVAIIEIVSSSNKRSQAALTAFIDKVSISLVEGVHLLLLDLYPPTKLAPDGIHGAIWEFLEGVDGQQYTQPKGEPLTMVSYVAGSPIRSFIEPLAVGVTLKEMPLFLTKERYINVPLEETYMAAYRGVPRRFKEILERTQE